MRWRPKRRGGLQHRNADGRGACALNQALSETYVAYGRDGTRFKENQVAQDEASADSSLPSAASRAVAKAGELYRNERLYLVDAQKTGVDVEELAPESLPEPMRAGQSALGSATSPLLSSPTACVVS